MRHTPSIKDTSPTVALSMGAILVQTATDVVLQEPPLHFETGRPWFRLICLAHDLLESTYLYLCLFSAGGHDTWTSTYPGLPRAIIISQR